MMTLGLPVRVARFFLVQRTKTGKIYQITIKYIYQMAVKYNKRTQKDQHLPLQVPPKFTQIRLFGLKLFHLAALPAVAKVA
jgi:hypothetical protein